MKFETAARAQAYNNTIIVDIEFRFFFLQFALALCTDHEPYIYCHFFALFCCAIFFLLFCINFGRCQFINLFRACWWQWHFARTTAHSILQRLAPFRIRIENWVIKYRRHDNWTFISRSFCSYFSHFYCGDIFGFEHSADKTNDFCVYCWENAVSSQEPAIANVISYFCLLLLSLVLLLLTKKPDFRYFSSPPPAACPFFLAIKTNKSKN